MLNNIKILLEKLKGLLNFSNTKKNDMPAVKRFMQSSLDVDFNFKEYANKNIFNKLSENSEYGFYYLPYTYGFRYPKWKNISDLGFRIKNFDELLLNKDNYFFINLYGCSNAYSILNSDLNTFSYLLEVKLNKDENIRRKIGKEIKILNFSRPANILFDQQLNHIIYGSLFDPKIILSHIGTDLTYSQLVDSYLLKKYKLNYVEIHELWSKVLHESNHPINLDNCEEGSQNFMNAKVKNSEKEIIEALFYRCNQFKKISETFGAHIIFGVTPFSISKKKLSSAEELRISKYNKYYSNAYKNLRVLIDKFQEQYAHRFEVEKSFISIHDKFKDLDERYDLFGDFAHCNEAGDRIISDIYYNYLKEVFDKKF